MAKRYRPSVPSKIGEEVRSRSGTEARRADESTRKGQSAALGDTGDGDPHVPPESQGISNRRGDRGQKKSGK
jgi:hypothetical protein